MIRSWFGLALGKILLALLLCMATQAAVPARPAHVGGNVGVPVADTPDHDDALNARARGEIMPLDEILQLLKPRKTDRMVDVVLDRRDERWIYEVTLLTKLGRYRIVTINAKDGVILKDGTK